MVLAAAISPPDTVTATAHGRAMGLPRRVVTILTGESLVNDAAALAIFTAAAASVTGTHTLIGSPILLFLYGAAAGILTGLVLGSAAGRIRARLQDPDLATAINLAVPFTAYLLAEHLDASGILAVVAAAFTVATRANHPGDARHRPLPYRTRLKESAVWPLIDTLLSVFVFAYLGLQLRFLIRDLTDSGQSLPRTLLAALVLLAAVIAVRLAWVWIVFGRWRIERRIREARYRRDPHARRWLTRRRNRALTKGPHLHPADPPDRYETLLVGWTGMRGPITLAAAAGIPLTTHTGTPFPGRATIQIVAFTVAVGTLLVQGTTLPLLARRLPLDTEAEARQEAQFLDDAQALARQRAHPPGDPDAQRTALARAVALGLANDEAARHVLHRIDLQQAAEQ